MNEAGAATTGIALVVWERSMPSSVRYQRDDPAAAEHPSLGRTAILWVALMRL